MAGPSAPQGWVEIGVKGRIKSWPWKSCGVNTLAFLLSLRITAPQGWVEIGVKGRIKSWPWKSCGVNTLAFLLSLREMEKGDLEPGAPKRTDHLEV